VQVPSWQVPAKQVAEALVKLHALPQVPQWVVLVPVFVSHPLVTLLSQLPQPALHAMVQAPPEHDGVPLVVEQETPQPPQLVTLALVLVSHPLAGLLSQLPQPVLQAPRVQTPVEHDSAAFGRSHSTPHPPQSVNDLSEVSQPFAALLSQLPNPDRHVGVQTPPVHEVEPLGLVQVLPQAPQLAVVLSATSQPLELRLSQLA
jgi:hypothetical protein